MSDAASVFNVMDQNRHGTITKKVRRLTADCGLLLNVD
jgi:hypothetical protein